MKRPNDVCNGLGKGDRHLQRIRNGWDPVEAVTTPPIKGRRPASNGGHVICVQPTMTRDRCGMRATHVTPDGKYVCAMHAREIAIVFYSSGGSLEPCKLIAPKE